MIYHKERLDDVHPTLVAFILTLIAQLEKHWPDWLIICGWRNQQDQHAAFLAGTSKVDWPNGKHNNTLVVVDENNMPVDIKPYSLAVDLSPYPYDKGKDRERLYLVAGYAMALADRLGYNIRIGADWDGDLQTLDQKLHDPWHIELTI